MKTTRKVAMIANVFFELKNSFKIKMLSQTIIRDKISIFQILNELVLLFICIIAVANLPRVSPKL